MTALAELRSLYSDPDPDSRVDAVALAVGHYAESRIQRERAAALCAKHRAAILAGRPPVQVLHAVYNGAAPDWAVDALAAAHDLTAAA